MSVNPKRLIDQLDEIAAQATHEWDQADPKDRPTITSRYLGGTGKLASILDGLDDLTPDDRKLLEQKANQIRSELSRHFGPEPRSSAGPAPYDHTRPGRVQSRGHRHILTKTSDDVAQIFYGMGFEIAEGPEIESDYHNFSALNFAPDHPSRSMQETFYLNDEYLLRTHLSAVQVRVFEQRRPPVRILASGRTYRRGTSTAHSSCEVHQIEGFFVDVEVTFADLKGVLTAFAQEYFGAQAQLRFRPSFNPFTEPSTEVDLRCLSCGGDGCPKCKGGGWRGLISAGMIDPNVFKAVDYDPEVFTGYAFGMGVERLVMLKHDIDDIRVFYDNDLRVLRQF